MASRYKPTLLQGTPERPPLWTKDFVLITLINLLLFLGFQFYPSALPPYVKTLGATDDVLGWLTAIATIATLITRPLAGLMLDRLGRRGVFLSGLLLMTAISGSMYFFPTVGVILALRFAHGLGWGIAGTAGSTIAADYIPKLRFGEGMGFFSLSASLGMAVSPAIALSLPPGPMFATATGFMAASVILALFLRYKKIEPRPAGKRRRNPYVIAAVPPALVMFLITVAFGATTTFLALYAAERGIGNIGPFFTVYALIMMITRPGTGRFVDKHGFALVIPLGLAALTVALLLLSRSANLWMFLLSAVFYGLGQGTVFTGTQTLAIMSSPPDRVGAANATFFTGFDAGIGAGAVIAGLLAGRFGYADMYLCMAACPALAFLCFIPTLRGLKKLRA